MQSNIGKDFWGSISDRLKNILQKGIYYSQYLYQYSVSQKASIQASQPGPIFPLCGPNIPHRDAVLCMYISGISFPSVQSSAIWIVFLEQLKDFKLSRDMSQLSRQLHDRVMLTPRTPQAAETPLVLTAPFSTTTDSSKSTKTDYRFVALIYGQWTSHTFV